MGKLNEQVLKKISEQLQDIKYGTLLITVYNDEVTQLDITKKHRFDKETT